MKTTFTFTATVLAIVHSALASPSQLAKRQDGTVTFLGAGPNPPLYTLSPPFDGTVVPIDNPLSVSTIKVNSEEGICTFRGADGTNTTVLPGSGNPWQADVGPPQVQLSARCCGFFCIGFPINCCG